MRFIVTLLSLMLLCTMSRAMSPQTVVYDIAGSDTLRLDFYRAESKHPTPLMIFAFGGGFKGGSRDEQAFMPMFEYMTRNGVSVASVDYRTLLGKVNPSEMMSAEGFKSHLIAAIDTAVTDFARATAYLDNHALQFNIDTKQIFACGSSAGAITVLQAEYVLANHPGAFSVYGLAPEFNYAGVISMAGAICSDGALRFNSAPCPLLMFHGDADAIVPFVKAELDGFGLWGSKTVSDTLAAEDIPHRFHRVNGASHEVSGTPMRRYCGEMYDFIRAVCDGEAGETVLTEESVPGKTDYKTDFTVLDYIKANL